MDHEKWLPPSLINKKIKKPIKIDLEQEKKTAFESGYEKAKKELQELADHSNEKEALKSLLANINNEFSEIKKNLKTELEELLKNCLDRLDSQNDKNEMLVTMRKKQIEEAIKLLKEHSSSNKIVMKLNPEDRELLNEQLNGQITVEYDDNIPRSSAKLFSNSTSIEIEPLDHK